MLLPNKGIHIRKGRNDVKEVISSIGGLLGMLVTDLNSTRVDSDNLYLAVETCILLLFH